MKSLALGIFLIGVTGNFRMNENQNCSTAKAWKPPFTTQRPRPLQHTWPTAAVFLQREQPYDHMIQMDRKTGNETQIWWKSSGVNEEIRPDESPLLVLRAVRSNTNCMRWNLLTTGKLIRISLCLITTSTDLKDAFTVISHSARTDIYSETITTHLFRKSKTMMSLKRVISWIIQIWG